MAAKTACAQNVITCEICTNLVSLYCKPCQIGLCQDCVVKHMLSKRSNDHNVVLFRERGSEPFYSECQKHTDVRCDLHCKTCDVLICAKCLIGSHAKHSYIDLDEQILANSRQCIEADIAELEKNIIPTYVKKQSESIAEIINRKQKYSHIQSAIDDHGSKWHREIDIVIEKLKAEVKAMEDKDLERLEKYQTDLNDVLLQAREVLMSKKYLLKSNNPSKIRQYKSRNDELKCVPPSRHLSFPSFTPITLQTEHLYRQFGKIKAVTEFKMRGLKIKNLQTPEVVMTTVTQKDRLWQMEYTNIDKLWISGKEDTIDLIDLHGTVQDTIKTLTGKKPQGLAVTKEGQLIYGEDFNINIATDGVTRTILTSFPWIPVSFCIAMSGELMAIMFYEDFTGCKIVRYDQDFKPKQEIQHDEQGNPLFKSGGKLVQITENKNTDICVTDGNADCLVVLNEEGKLRWRYKGNKLSTNFTPRGIATDSQCHVLVADLNSHCIHVISKNGQFLCIIQNCNLVYPLVLSIDNEDRLFVAECTTNINNKIKVIKYLK